MAGNGYDRSTAAMMGFAYDPSGENEGLRNRITLLTAEVEALRLQVVHAESERDTSRAEITPLARENEALRTEIESLKAPALPGVEG